MSASLSKAPDGEAVPAPVVPAFASGPGRFGFIDNAKAIGIVLVVLGHSRGLPEALGQLFFGFHVPLFFFLSGFLLKPDRLRLSGVSNARQVLRTLGLPYLFFFLLAWAYWLATRHVGAKALLNVGQAWSAPVYGFFTGIEYDLFVDPPLWFFPCLIATIVVYHAARKMLSAGQSACLFALIAVVLAIGWRETFPYRLPLGLDTMGIALFFYALGQYLRARDVLTPQAWKVLLAATLISLGLLLYMGALNGRVDLANMRFGVIPVLYLPAALAGIAATLSICQWLPRSRLADWLSENTLTIFPAHFLFLSLVRGAATSLHLIPGEYQYGLGWSILSSVLAIALCVPLVFFLRLLPASLAIVRQRRPLVLMHVRYRQPDVS
jgi:acyltransferase